MMAGKTRRRSGKATTSEEPIVQAVPPEGERRRGIRAMAVAAGTLAVAATIRAKERRRKKRATEPERRERVTVQLPVSLIEHARNAVFWTEGLTLTTLLEEALRQALARLVRKRGAPFEPRTGELKVGRPVAAR